MLSIKGTITQELVAGNIEKITTRNALDLHTAWFTVIIKTSVRLKFILIIRIKHA